MEKVVWIDETEVTMRATAATLIKYRSAFNRDLIADLQAMSATGGDTLADGAAETVSRLAYVMDVSRDKGTFAEWLDRFSPLGVLNAGADILGLWMDSQKTLVSGKKK